MCGIAGLLSTHHNQDELRAAVLRMKQAIIHRGPDSEGTFIGGTDLHVALGHRRLAIIDPENGQQPMVTQDGDLAIVFNGAIYNYIELRQELIALGHSFKTHCDTEVLLVAYRQWGRACVDKLRGMFAFALWDNRQQQLYCARDRVGIKPFYYALTPQGFIFGSEIKALLASGWIKAKQDAAGFMDYTTFQFYLGEKTLFENIYRLEPGYSLTVHNQQGAITARATRYWDMEYHTQEPLSAATYQEQLHDLLHESVRLHLRSDVPLGAHLSGGLDSSTIACLAARELGARSLKTFTGAFSEGPAFDETHHAKTVAAFAKTDYHETYISGHNLAQDLPHLIYMMDEPLAGPGLIPQYYVSKLAAEKVKVVLGGQGGDELYLGYARYFAAYLEESLKRAIYPEAMTDPTANLADLITSLPLLSTYQPLLQQLWRNDLFGPCELRYLRLIDRSEGLRHLFSPDVWPTDYPQIEQYQQLFNQPKTSSFINKMAYFDFKTSLPALLQVEDRTSMAVSLESRVPLLDHKLVELMARIPADIKFKQCQPKALFKSVIRPYLPASIVDRKDKMGFPVPLTQWLKSDLKEFAQDILFSQRTRERGLFNHTAVVKAYQESSTFSRVIWGLLCIELWQRQFIDGEGLL